MGRSAQSRRTAVPAYVLGDVDLVAALGRGGVPVVLISAPDEPARRSRYVQRWVPAVEDHWAEQEVLAQRLVEAAHDEPSPPVLYPQTDGDLLAVSRHRDVLAPHFRLPLASPELIEIALDKTRFAGLAERLDLPTPRTWRLPDDPDVELEPPFPVIVKPALREGLIRMDTRAKGLRADDRGELRVVREQLLRAGVPAVVQELVEGPESAVESWHGYVRTDGVVAGEFTGRKVRTWPARHGHSTVLMTTDPQGDAADVRAASHDVVRRTGLTGVAKLDWKRGTDGRLHLLEINPRFTLWQHLGAVAGVDLPALVHSYCTGAPLPPMTRPRPGVVWCDPLRDLRGVLATEVPVREWLRTVTTSDVRSGASAGDLRPLLSRLLMHRKRSGRRL